MGIKEAVRAVRLGTCAIGYSKVDKVEFQARQDIRQFVIVGTGFLCAPKVVLTNRHVVRDLDNANQSLNSPAGRCWAMFPRAVAGSAEVAHTFVTIAAIGVVGSPVQLDVATVHLAESPANAAPLEVVERFTQEVGDEIALYGYPHGTKLFQRAEEDGENLYRFGPVLKRGYVAAIAPYDEGPVVERLLLDARTEVGMSGSPVFETASGKVIGIHTSGTSLLEFALPLTAERTRFFASAAHGQHELAPLLR